ncbi:MAG: serine/threonine protein kinase [Bacteroidota bacterium]
MIGQQILSYRIEKLIGEGGMGNVYLGVHTHIGRKVAIKALNPNLAKNPELKERFKNEASTLSQLHHPNIVSLFDYVETDMGIFLVMEYVEGMQMDEYIQKVTGPIPEEKVIPLFVQILDGVSYAHHRNVIHRDIKPSNIIITEDGKAKILDFGIAKIISDTSHKLTKTGTKMGTVLFMSPEQVKGSELDKRTDIYSLGITLFQAITGKSPYDDQSSEYEVYKRIVEEPLPDAKQFYVGVSPRIENIIKKATAKNRDDRYEDCDEFKNALLGKESAKEKPVKVSDNTVKPQAVRNKEKPVKEKTVTSNKRRKGWIVFWNIFFGLLLTTGLIATAFKLLYPDHEMYVMANKLWLRTSKNINDQTNGITLLKFGDKVTMVESDSKEGSDGLHWAEVTTDDKKKGYIASDYLGSEDDYEIAKEIFPEEAIKDIPVQFKKAVINYYQSKGMIKSGNKSDWKVKSNLSSSEYSNYFLIDLNEDGRDDLACVSENPSESKHLLLVFTSENDQDTKLIYSESSDETIYMKRMVKGTKYFTGKYTEESQIDFFGEIKTIRTKVFDTVKKSGLLLLDKKDGQNYLLAYDVSSNEFVKTPFSK